MNRFFDVSTTSIDRAVFAVTSLVVASMPRQSPRRVGLADLRVVGERPGPNYGTGRKRHEVYGVAGYQPSDAVERISSNCSARR